MLGDFGQRAIGGCLLLALLCLDATNTLGQTAGTRISFPYTAYAARSGVLVHSGPGEEHYATQELPQGEIVEVHRHDPDDWCAIRPPAGAFSIVPAEMIEVISADRGRCRSDGVQVWVGTDLGPVERPLWQVKLKAGETVELLGEISYPSDEGFSTQWYQIAPPAGEFRWVRRQDLLLPDPRTRQLATPATPTPAHRQIATPPASADTIRTVQGTDTLDNPFPDDPVILGNPPTQPGESAQANTDNQGWRKARIPLRIAQADPGSTGMSRRFDGAAAGNNGSADPGFDSRGVAGASSSFNPNNRYEPAEVINAQLTPTFGSDPLSPRLQQLDLELASEIIKPPEMWQLSAFADRLLRIQESAESPLESQQARRLIDKVDRLRSTQARLVESNVGSRRPPATQTSAAVGSGVNTEVQYGTTYDAYGWLSQLTRSSGKVEPGYVLQDDQGKIICILEPSPGLNLHRYLNSKVGVVGTRGYDNRLKVNHVTADRVVVLENPRNMRR